MARCETFACYLETIREQRERNSNSPSNTGSNNNSKNDGDLDTLEKNPNMRIIFPVLLVIGVFVVIAIGFLVYRFMFDYVHKRWIVWRQGGNNQSSNANVSQNHRTRRNGRTNQRGLSTVSGGIIIDRPPSYRQVLATIQRDEMPPSYDAVIQGVVNDGFVNETESQRTLSSESFGNTYENVNEVIQGQTNIQQAARNRAIEEISISPSEYLQNESNSSIQQPSVTTTSHQPSRRIDIPPSPSTSNYMPNSSQNPAPSTSSRHETEECGRVSVSENSQTTSTEMFRSKSDVSNPRSRADASHLHRSSTTYNHKVSRNNLNKSVLNPEQLMSEVVII